MGSPGGGKIPLSRSVLWNWIVRRNPAFANVHSPEDQPESIRVMLEGGKGNALFSTRPNQSEPGKGEEDGLDLLVVDWTFGTEELSAYSGPIQKVEDSPKLFMHPLDASRAGLADKVRCLLHLDGGPLEVDVRVAHPMAPGVIVLPRHRQLPWQKLKRWPIKVRLNQLERLGIEG
jgi:hypothetical protein